MSVLRIDQLTKNYGAIRAVDHLSLTVEAGNIYGILGPNGSGKTTTLGMILGITHPDSGSFSWFDSPDPHSARRRIGALLETPNFYPYLNAVDNLKIVAAIKGRGEEAIEEHLRLVRLHERRHSKFKTYSLGMKQRLAIAGALVGDPDVLIFDEPTNGLDPEGIAEVRETLMKIAARGKTVIMASHILDEVEKICSHVAIIKRGKLLATGTVGAILSNNVTVEIGAADIQALKRLIQEEEELHFVSESGDRLILDAEAGFSAERINEVAFKQGIILTHLSVKQRSLESEFLEITRQN
ncbi:MAG: ATP-binding cassette domain-containing protein [Bacteroidetes bacterium]|nr:ATP-binding cassette domain-containing protein [Bacteroidota bacterium]